MKNIIFIAPPAAGKGTQSTFLEDKFGYVHLSTGDMLREASQSDTEDGKKIKAIIDSGSLVSDELMINLIKDKLSKLQGKPFILDGFPRTLPQAESLKSILGDEYIVIYLSLPEEIAMKRALGRMTCSKCGRSYNEYFMEVRPKTDGICDGCGNILEKRKDDTEESFKIRFQTYLMNTAPLLDYYGKLNKVKEIDVDKDALKVSKEIEAIID